MCEWLLNSNSIKAFTTECGTFFVKERCHVPQCPIYEFKVLNFRCGKSDCDLTGS